MTHKLIFFNSRIRLKEVERSMTTKFKILHFLLFKLERTGLKTKSKESIVNNIVRRVDAKPTPLNGEGS